MGQTFKILISVKKTELAIQLFGMVPYAAYNFFTGLVLVKYIYIETLPVSVV